MGHYDVVWDKPSRDSSGSMPLGNGDIGLNVWVEQDGDLLFYIGETDAWSENARLLKVGRIRVKFTPNPFLGGMPFTQTLDIETGCIEIRAGDKDSEVLLSLWVDANHPVVRVEAAGASPFEIEAAVEVWRDSEHVLPEKDHYSAWELDEGPEPVIVYPDTVLDVPGERIVWFHRNRKSLWPLTMEHQGLEEWLARSEDPLLNRTFGCAVEGNGLLKKDARTLKSGKPRAAWAVSVYPLTSQTDTADEWVRELEDSIRSAKAADLHLARKAHRKWWKDFWERS